METFQMGSKVPNAHFQRSVNVRHTHPAMPAARGSVLLHSTACAVSGVCMGSPDSQLTLLTSEVKCNACSGIRQFMSQKPFVSNCQEEQKARIWDADHCSSSLALRALSTWPQTTEIPRSSTHKVLHHCAYVIQHHWSGLKIWENAHQHPENHTERCWCRTPPFMTGPITICLACARRGSQQKDAGYANSKQWTPLLSKYQYGFVS